jgi:4-amino-4-deoxy-L-arabinose transferase-like glycosyltransferase
MHLWLQGGATADAPAAAAPSRPVAPELVAPEHETQRPGLLRRAAGHPELWLLLALAAALNLWALDTNGWANDYYAAAVRSMTESWHNFLFGSFDPAGVMTVDKPPLALWVQALSARIFGLSSLSILVPQAIMGVAAVGLTWDLTRRRFGRAGGFVAGLALALTPTAVAIFRHNNPDAVVLLCSVAALWAIVRALEDGRTRWLVLAGAMIGLGFEAKMGAALLVVPALAAAYLWVSPRGYLASLRQLLAGFAALVVVGGIWPLLVWLTPAADRPYVSGTDDNSIWSLILGYNGIGRLAGQSGGPGGAAGGGPGGGAGGGGGLFGGTTGPFRLLNEALGPQGAWLLGFALVGGIAIAVASRLRRSDARTGWIIATGGAALTMALAFSYASGIFHPYYVSVLAPFTAALVGGTAAELIRGGTFARIVAPMAIAVGVGVELVVVDRAGNLDWLPPVLIVAGAATAATLAIVAAPRIRAAAVAVFLAAALAGPAIWSVQTLGHATNGTFPAGGPATAGFGGGPGGGPGPAGGGFRRGGFGAGPAPGAAQGGPPAMPGGGGMFGGSSDLTQALAYAKANGGGTVAVSSQQGASNAIIRSGADVAGIGGFSGRESEPSVAWFAQEVRDGNIRWVLTGGQMGGPGGDSRAGSTAVMTAVQNVCTAIPSSAYEGTTGSTTTDTFGSTSSSGLYDCRGKADALADAAA